MAEGRDIADVPTFTPKKCALRKPLLAAQVTSSFGTQATTCLPTSKGTTHPECSCWPRNYTGDVVAPRRAVFP